MVSGFFFQAEDGIRDGHVTGVQTCALPISMRSNGAPPQTAREERCWIRMGTYLVGWCLTAKKRREDRSVRSDHVADGFRSEERRVGRAGGPGRGRAEEPHVGNEGAARHARA